MITVTVAKVPGRVVDVSLEDDTTVDAALELAGHDSDGYDVKVNNMDADGDTILEDGDKVFLTRQIKGNG